MNQVKDIFKKEGVIDLVKAFLWLRYYTKSSRLRTKVIALETDRPVNSRALRQIP